jgi:hypothetical protein
MFHTKRAQVLISLKAPLRRKRRSGRRKPCLKTDYKTRGLHIG